MQTGEQLNRLNNQWVSLVSCNFEIESAIKQLEVQILQMKSSHPKQEEKENKEEVYSNGNGVNEDNDEEME